MSDEQPSGHNADLTPTLEGDASAGNEDNVDQGVTPTTGEDITAAPTLVVPPLPHGSSVQPQETSGQDAHTPGTMDLEQPLSGLTLQQLAAVVKALSQTSTSTGATPHKEPTYDAPTVQQMQRWTHTSGPMSYKHDVLQTNVKQMMERVKSITDCHDIILQELLLLLKSTHLDSSPMVFGKTQRFKTSRRLIDHPFLLGEAIIGIRTSLPKSWWDALEEASPIQSEAALMTTITPLRTDRDPALRVAQQLALNTNNITTFRRLQHEFKFLAGVVTEKVATPICNNLEEAEQTIDQLLARIRVLEVTKTQYQHLSIAHVIQGRHPDVAHEMLEVVRDSPAAPMTFWLTKMESILQDRSKKRKPTGEKEQDTPFPKKGRLSDQQDSPRPSKRPARLRPTTGRDDISPFVDGFHCTSCPNYHQGKACKFNKDMPYDWTKFHSRWPEGFK